VPSAAFSHDADAICAPDRVKDLLRSAAEACEVAGEEALLAALAVVSEHYEDALATSLRVLSDANGNPFAWWFVSSDPEIYRAGEAVCKGNVKITLSDPKAKVEVKVDGDSIEIAGLDEPLRLRPAHSISPSVRNCAMSRGAEPSCKPCSEPSRQIFPTCNTF